jgi:hypothetical protein
VSVSDKDLTMRVDKEYPQPFLLEPMKLRRLVDVIHERLDDHHCTTRLDHFEVFLSGNRREEHDNVDAVLAVGNSRKHRITRLLITCTAGKKGATRPDHEIQIDFARSKKVGSNVNKVVGIIVSSDAPGWPHRTISELEEQVERTWQHYWQGLLILLVILLFALLVIVVQVASLPSMPNTLDVTRTMWLRSPDLDHVEKMLRNGRTITDEEMRDIATRQLRNVLEDQRPKPKTGRFGQAMYVVTPLLVILICGGILMFSCYPHAVFLWGDEEEQYRKLEQRRQMLRSIIIGVIVIGLLANLLTAGIASWGRRE